MGIEDVPLPPKYLCEWFLMEFGYTLESFWTPDGLNVDGFKALVLGDAGVSDDDLMYAIKEKYGYRAARLIYYLEEYLQLQVNIYQMGRLN